MTKTHFVWRVPIQVFKIWTYLSLFLKFALYFFIFVPPDVNLKFALYFFIFAPPDVNLKFALHFYICPTWRKLEIICKKNIVPRNLMVSFPKSFLSWFVIVSRDFLMFLVTSIVLPKPLCRFKILQKLKYLLDFSNRHFSCTL